MTDKQLAQLKKKIEEIESLKAAPAWGAEFQLWKDMTEKLVKEMFGDNGFKLFHQQQSVALDDDAYVDELVSRKKMLEGLLANREEYRPAKYSFWTDSGVPETAFSVAVAILYLCWKLVSMVFIGLWRLCSAVVVSTYKRVVNHLSWLLYLLLIGAALYVFHILVK